MVETGAISQPELRVERTVTSPAASVSRFTSPDTASRK
jgi:hypothetical protein